MRIKAIFLMMIIISNFVYGAESNLQKFFHEVKQDCNEVINAIPESKISKRLNNQNLFVSLKNSMETRRDTIIDLQIFIDENKFSIPESLRIPIFPADKIKDVVQKITELNHEKPVSEGMLFAVASQLRKAQLLPKINANYIVGGLGLLTTICGLSSLLSGNMKEATIEFVKIMSINALSGYATYTVAKTWNPYIDRLDKGKFSDCQHRLIKYISKLDEGNDRFMQAINNIKNNCIIKKQNDLEQIVCTGFEGIHNKLESFGTDLSTTKSVIDSLHDRVGKLQEDISNLNAITEDINTHLQKIDISIQLTAKQVKDILLNFESDYEEGMSSLKQDVGEVKALMIYNIMMSHRNCKLIEMMHSNKFKENYYNQDFNIHLPVSTVVLANNSSNHLSNARKESNKTENSYVRQLIQDSAR
ncbi:MAG: hypothetical protein JO129_01505 [Candidatus Dependentiae bacterium]|nr:hypothetical protein [Candidatus Dependentiae bacterium]